MYILYIYIWYIECSYAIYVYTIYVYIYIYIYAPRTPHTESLFVLFTDAHKAHTKIKRLHTYWSIAKPTACDSVDLISVRYLVVGLRPTHTPHRIAVRIVHRRTQSTHEN